tara:strand:+ start:240 stop:1385 length:1146 start_codon:yes stop_codon:yes gene_type:complete
MKILHVIGSLSIGGVQKFILELSKTSSLKNYNHEVLCTFLSENSYLDEYDKSSIVVKNFVFSRPSNINIPYKLDVLMRKISLFLFIFRFWYYLLKSDINIIHSHIHSNIVSQILASILSGKRIIWTIHGEYTIRPYTRFWIKILDTILSNKKFHIIADSEAALLSSLTYYKNKLLTSHIIPTGININPFLIKYDIGSLRSKYNFKKDIILIGSTGRIVWQKGYDQLINILEKYTFDTFKFHILIAGDGSLREQMIKKVEEKKLDQHISFIGNIQNVPEFLSMLDIYIQPSITEGYPLSVLEAMAAKLPIITSNAGGLDKMIDHDINGWKYEARNIDELFEILKLAMNSSKKKLFNLSSNAFKKINIENNIENIAKVYNSIY